MTQTGNESFPELMEKWGEDMQNRKQKDSEPKSAPVPKQFSGVGIEFEVLTQGGWEASDRRTYDIYYARNPGDTRIVRVLHEGAFPEQIPVEIVKSLFGAELNINCNLFENLDFPDDVRPGQVLNFTSTIPLDGLEKAALVRGLLDTAILRAGVITRNGGEFGQIRVRGHLLKNVFPITNGEHVKDGTAIGVVWHGLVEN